MPAQVAFEPNQTVVHAVLLIAFFWRQALEQYSTCSQFLAQALRQVISRPHALQGLLGRLCLFPRNEF